MNEKTKGYIYGVVAAAAYGLNPLFAVPLYDAGMDVESVLFFRYLFAIPMVAVTLLARGRDFRVHSRETLPLIIMGILMAFSSMALFHSYNYMDAGIAHTAADGKAQISALGADAQKHRVPFGLLHLIYFSALYPAAKLGCEGGKAYTVKRHYASSIIMAKSSLRRSWQPLR